MAKKNLAAKKKSEDLETKFLQEIDSMGYDGFENVDNNSLSPPFLKIAQLGTPQIIKGDPAYIDGLQPGDFFNSSNGKKYGSKIKVVLLGYVKNYIKWGQQLGEFGGTLNQNDFDELLPKLLKEGMIYHDEDGNKYVDTRTLFVYLTNGSCSTLLIISIRC